MTTVTTGNLLQTIEADLKAGESWLEQEALGAGLFIWNTLKGAFIALGPTLGNDLVAVLTGAVQNAAAGDSVETIETNALNTATADGKAALAAAGSAVSQQIIIGIKNNLTSTVATATATAAT